MMMRRSHFLSLGVSSRNLRSTSKYKSLRKRVGRCAMLTVPAASSKFNELSPNSRKRTLGGGFLEHRRIRSRHFQQFLLQLLDITAMAGADRQAQSHLGITVAPIGHRIRDQT
jgi:hypothetical protein